uniref:Putative secreted protein n=1 Tax=Ixodes ricinus TaxID=34613 RepID=A0A6B0U6L4_IXORI
MWTDGAASVAATGLAVAAELTAPAAAPRQPTLVHLVADLLQVVQGLRVGELDAHHILFHLEHPLLLLLKCFIEPCLHFKVW